MQYYNIIIPYTLKFSPGIYFRDLRCVITRCARAWVTKAPVAKARGTRNINVANADHSQAFIHRENIWYYDIQTVKNGVSGLFCLELSGLY